MFQYTGDYIQVFLERENKYYTNKTLYEIVVYKCLDKNSYITLSPITTKYGNSSYLVNLLWRQIPINSKDNSNILHRFTIKNEHILLGINSFKNEYSIYDIISIIKDINNSFIESKSCDVYSLLDFYDLKPNTTLSICPYNGISSMSIPLVNFLVILKYIFYIEDYKYPKSYNLGRYLLQLCILDYLFDGSDYCRTVKKYNNLIIKNTQ